jgi:hypothetical protein
VGETINGALSQASDEGSSIASTLQTAADRTKEEATKALDVVKNQVLPTIAVGALEYCEKRGDGGWTCNPQLDGAVFLQNNKIALWWVALMSVTGWLCTAVADYYAHRLLRPQSKLVKGWYFWLPAALSALLLAVPTLFLLAVFCSVYWRPKSETTPGLALGCSLTLFFVIWIWVLTSIFFYNKIKRTLVVPELQERRSNTEVSVAPKSDFH